MFNLGEYDPDSHGLYISLDSLFDTRLASLDQVDTALALENLQNGWKKRLADVPVGIDAELFKQLYSGRDAHTLGKALETPVFEIVRHWVMEAIKKLSTAPVEQSLKLYVNFFPYQLSKDKAIDLGTVIMEHLATKCNIELINVDPKKICPLTARRYFDGMIMYDAMEWIDSHVETFSQTAIPMVTLYAPAFFAWRLPSEQEMAQFKQDGKDPFKEIEQLSSATVALEFLPIEVFSAKVMDVAVEAIVKELPQTA